MLETLFDVVNDLAAFREHEPQAAVEKAPNGPVGVAFVGLVKVNQDETVLLALPHIGGHGEGSEQEVKPPLGRDPAAGVRDQVDDLGAGGRAERAQADLAGQVGAVLAATQELAPGALELRPERPPGLGPTLQMDLAKAGREQQIDRLPDQLSPFPTKEHLHLAVGKLDRPGPIDHQDAVRGRFQKGLRPGDVPARRDGSVGDILGQRRHCYSRPSWPATANGRAWVSILSASFRSFLPYRYEALVHGLWRTTTTAKIVGRAPVSEL